MLPLQFDNPSAAVSVYLIRYDFHDFFFDMYLTTLVEKNIFCSTSTPVSTIASSASPEVERSKPIGSVNPAVSLTKLPTFVPALSTTNGAATTAGADLTSFVLSGYQQQLAAANYMQHLQRMIAMENLSKQYSGIWPGAAATATPLVGATAASGGSWSDTQHMFGSLMTSDAATTGTTKSPVNLTNPKDDSKK